MDEPKQPRKPITATEAALILAYVLIALVRQVRHDVRSILRWASS
jgi:hypothetical protein